MNRFLLCLFGLAHVFSFDGFAFDLVAHPLLQINRASQYDSIPETKFDEQRCVAATVVAASFLLETEDVLIRQLSDYFVFSSPDSTTERVRLNSKNAVGYENYFKRMKEIQKRPQKLSSEDIQWIQDMLFWSQGGDIKTEQTVYVGHGTNTELAYKMFSKAGFIPVFDWQSKPFSYQSIQNDLQANEVLYLSKKGTKKNGEDYQHALLIGKDSKNRMFGYDSGYRESTLYLVPSPLAFEKAFPADAKYEILWRIQSQQWQKFQNK